MGQVASTTSLKNKPSFDMQSDFFDALSCDDIPRAANILADNVLFLFPGIRPVQGKMLTTRMLRVIRRRFLDIRWTQTMVSVVRLDAEGRVAYLSDYFKSTDFTARGASAPAHASTSAIV